MYINLNNTNPRSAPSTNEQNKSQKTNDFLIKRCDPLLVISTVLEINKTVLFGFFGDDFSLIEFFTNR